MSKGFFSPTLKRILLEALILCTLSLAVGLSINFRLVMDAFTGKTVVTAPPPTTVAGSEAQPGQPMAFFPDPVDLDELDELLAAGALLIDARNLRSYQESHLAGAVSLPLGELDVRLADFIRQVPKERILIPYCTGFGCPDSFDLGVRLMQEGYLQVRVFEGGYPQWRDEGRDLEEGLK